MNGSANSVKRQNFRFDGLLGFRYVNLVDSLNINDQFSGNSFAGLTFLGAPVDPSNTLSDFDKLRTRNNFYGGQLGGRVNWMWGRLTLWGAGKLALGT